METLGLKAAAAFLRCHPEELRRRARAGIVPGAKIGRAWYSWKVILLTMFARAMLDPGKRCK